MSKVFINRSSHGRRAGLGAILLAVSLSGWCLPEDRQQPIHIESNRAERQERSGLTIYEGDVIITQGTIRIEADKVVVHSENNQAVRFEATGGPARYQQVIERGDPPVQARSQLIDYRMKEDRLILSRDAQLEQDGATIAGERIEYDLIHEIIRAQGDLEGRQRIHMVIPPAASTRNESSESPASSPGTGEQSPTDTPNSSSPDTQPNGN